MAHHGIFFHVAAGDSDIEILRFQSWRYNGLMQPALFLDRDGVIIENRDDYVRSWEDVSFLPGALEALAKLQPSHCIIVILTNQSAIGRGIISRDQADEINRRILEVIQQVGGRVDAVYLCPHAPHEHCSCRKPEPGLFIQAAADLSIDLPRSIMVGDALTDLQAGARAGIEDNILVLTGRGARQRSLPLPEGLGAFQTFDSLAAAVDHIQNSL